MVYSRRKHLVRALLAGRAIPRQTERWRILPKLHGNPQPTYRGPAPVCGEGWRREHYPERPHDSSHNAAALGRGVRVHERGGGVLDDATGGCEVERVMWSAAWPWRVRGASKIMKGRK